jgi:5'-nucleotidase
MEHFRGADFLHFNTSYPAFLSEDPSTPLQSADHDPLEGRFQFEQTGTDFMLTVLHNNDGESQLINAGSGIEDFGGVARFATLVDHLRSEASAEGSGVLMVSSGDNFLAGPEFNASLEKGVPFYDTIAMQLIGYDAAAIGNHEFDFGPEVLADFIEGFNGTLPFVSANLDFSGEPSLQALVDQGVIVKSLAIEEAGETIGIVGATTPFLPFISSPRNVTVDPEVAAAIQGQVDQLQAQGIDKIMVISHLQAVAEDVALAAELSGVDIMIAGGGDEVLANPGDLLVPGDEIQGPYPLYATGADGTVIPVVTTAGNYKYVGQLIVEFLGGTLVWVENESGPVRVAGGDNPDAVEPDPEVQAQVVEPVMASIAELANNVIGQSEVDLDGLRNNVRTQETNEGNLIADALLWQAAQLADTFGVAPPDVALQNGGGIRNDSIIPAGPITELNTFEMLPFANFVSIVPDVPREQFKEIMENAVSRVEFVDGRFAQIAGFDMVWDPSGTPQVLDENGNVVTPGTRVLEITLDDGTPIVSGGAVVDGPALSVATIDFLARGGDQYPFRGVPFTTLGVTYQQALSDYIVEALDGLITAAQYPFGGEGRITTP